MTLDDIQKIIDGDGQNSSVDYPARYMGVPCELMRKLLAVVKAADRLSDDINEFDFPSDGIFVENLDDALADLEKE